jgi:hypothetical protein
LTISGDDGRFPKSSEMAAGLAVHQRLIRNRRQREMYGPAHNRRRKQFAKRIERGEEIRCPRCGDFVGPDQEWDLGHDDYNPALERPEHRACNRSAPNLQPHSRVW